MLDNGASYNITNDASHLTNVTAFYWVRWSNHGDGGMLPIAHISFSHLTTNDSSCCTLKNGLDAPTISSQFFSVNKLCTYNHVFIKIHAGYFLVKNTLSKKFLLQGRATNGLYIQDRIE